MQVGATNLEPTRHAGTPPRAAQRSSRRTHTRMGASLSAASFGPPHTAVHGTSVSSLYAARHSAAEGPDDDDDDDDDDAPPVAAAIMSAATSGKWRTVATRQPCVRTRPRKRLRGTTQVSEQNPLAPSSLRSRRAARTRRRSRTFPRRDTHRDTHARRARCAGCHASPPSSQTRASVVISSAGGGPASTMAQMMRNSSGSVSDAMLASTRLLWGASGGAIRSAGERKNEQEAPRAAKTTATGTTGDGDCSFSKRNSCFVLHDRRRRQGARSCCARCCQDHRTFARQQGQAAARAAAIRARLRA
jgi:hypothetical protein